MKNSRKRRRGDLEKSEEIRLGKDHDAKLVDIARCYEDNAHEMVGLQSLAADEDHRPILILGDVVHVIHTPVVFLLPFDRGVNEPR